MNTTLKKESRKYNSKFFPFYQSHTQSKGSVSEYEPKDVGINIWKYIIPIGAVIGFAIFYMVQAVIHAVNPPIPKRVADSAEAPVNTQLAQKNGIVKDKESIFIKEGVKLIESIKEAYNRVPEKTIDDVMRAPFDDFSFYLKAKIQGKEKQVYLFGAHKSGVDIDVTGEELGQVGYTIREVANCILILDHKYTKQSQYVYCRKVDTETGKGSTASIVPDLLTKKD